MNITNWLSHLEIDVSQIVKPLLIFITESVIETFDHKEYPNCLAAIENIVKLLKENCTDTDKIKQAIAEAGVASKDAGFTAVAAINVACYAAEEDTNVYIINTACSAIATSNLNYDTYLSYEDTKRRYYKKIANKLIELLKDYNDTAY